MALLDRIVTKSFRRRVIARVRRWTRWPPVGRIDFGDLRRLAPISKDWGYDRGRPVDRYYIERFLSRHAEAVRGRVLEVGTSMYTRRFGGDRVSRSDVLHVSDELPGVTMVADLTQPAALPADTFDCVILTQTLQFIYDIRATLATVERALRPGGVLLLTVPGIAQISREDMDRWGDYWRFTTLAVSRLLDEAFPGAVSEVRAFGNVLAAVAFLEGVASEELADDELDYVDQNYELVIAARVAKRGGAG